jgi:hypothetical protein
MSLERGERLDRHLSALHDLIEEVEPDLGHQKPTDDDRFPRVLDHVLSHNAHKDLETVGDQIKALLLRSRKASIARENARQQGIREAEAANQTIKHSLERLLSAQSPDADISVAVTGPLAEQADVSVVRKTGPSSSTVMNYRLNRTTMALVLVSGGSTGTCGRKTDAAPPPVGSANG